MLLLSLAFSSTSSHLRGRLLRSARTPSSNQAEGERGEAEAEHQNAGDKNTVSNGFLRSRRLS